MLVLLIGWVLTKVVCWASWVFFFFFGRFGGGCIGIVYLELLFWHLFLYEIFLYLSKKKKKKNNQIAAVSLGPHLQFNATENRVIWQILWYAAMHHHLFVMNLLKQTQHKMLDYSTYAFLLGFHSNAWQYYA